MSYKTRYSRFLLVAKASIFIPSDVFFVQPLLSTLLHKLIHMLYQIIMVRNNVKHIICTIMYKYNSKNAVWIIITFRMFLSCRNCVKLFYNFSVNALWVLLTNKRVSLSYPISNYHACSISTSIHIDSDCKKVNHKF